jgi:DNA-directed RNA polymerase specialized sigma24 family protein
MRLHEQDRMNPAVPIPDPAERIEDHRSAPSLWPETDWDRVLALRDPAAYEEAIAEMCRIYRPVFVRVLARWNPSNSEDLAHDFIISLIAKQRLQRADPALGRFRQYVGKMLMNFVRKQHHHGRRQKRGGGAEHVELTEQMGATEDPAAEIFDRAWAHALLERVVEAFKQEHARPEILRLALRELAQGDATVVTEGYAEVAANTGSAESTLRTEVTRTRRRFYERLKQEVALTTVRSEIDEELRHLLRVLLSRGGK